MIGNLPKKATAYVYRFLKKRGLTAAELCENFKGVIKRFNYLSRNHFIVKVKLVKRKTNVILKYNTLQKFICRPKKKRKGPKALETWSKKVAVYRRTQHAEEKLPISVVPAAKAAPGKKLLPGDILKLKERLEQYKNNSTKIDQVDANDVLQDKPIASIETSRCATPVPSDPNTTDDLIVDESSSVGILDCSEVEKKSLTPPESLDAAISTPSISKGSKFLDSLINKLKNNGENVFVKKRVVKPNKPAVLIESSNEKIDMSVPAVPCDEESSNSSDFLGFTETDASFGLLGTPIVPKQFKTDKSAFISERLDTFLRENSLENRAQVEIPKHRSFEEGMVCKGAQPPKILMPMIPDEISKARTVAEKRLLFAKKRDVKYYMIENENTIYREIKKRSKYGINNVKLIEHIQNLDIPFTRDSWKASAWLHTINGRFYFQLINIDGISYKMIGGKGNHCRKNMGLQSALPVKRPKRLGCPKNCTQHLNFKNIKLRQPIRRQSIEEIVEKKDFKKESLEIKKESPKLLTTASWCKGPAYKAGPLSKKCANNMAVKIDMGDIQVYKLPTIQLQVFPQLNQPLDELVKPYLKLILPSDKISKEWAEFAVSTLQTKNESKQTSSLQSSKSVKKSFLFDIPYVNDQKTLLVRKIFKRHEQYSNDKLDDGLNFRKSINPENDVEVTCGDILTEMIDSVAIGLSEDSFTKNDPDIDYIRNDVKEKDKVKVDQVIESSKKNKQPKKSVKRRKLLLELKRLNATVVDAKNMYTPDIAKCTEETCRLGCICYSIATQSGTKTHCKKDSCMFHCTCKNNVSLDNDKLNKALSNEDALLIREKATARLARMEKEFCATVVLTDNKTYLINESQSDKRRLKRVPRRYGDFVNDNVNATNLVIESNEQQSGVKLSPTVVQKNTKISLKKFKHCNVVLRNLEDLEDIEPWCMIHCLYKCFCRGKATEGNIFEIKKEAVVDEDVVYARKRRYSFDKEEDNLVMQKAAKRKYFAAAYNSCSRVNAVPSQVYHTLNRQKLNSVRTKAKSDETALTRNILSKRIVKSSMYMNRIMPVIKKPRIEIANQTIQQVKFSPPKVISNSNPVVKTIQISQNRSNQRQDATKPTPNAIDNSYQGWNQIIKPVKSFEMANIHVKLKEEQRSNSQSTKTTNTSANSLATTSEKDKTKREDTSKFEQEFQFEGTMRDSDALINSCGSTSPIRNYVQNCSMPVITSVRSLNATSSSKAIVPQIKMSNVKISPDDFHANAIGKLNLAVTKTMQSICNIQKKNSKIIPPPATKTLSSLQWRFFSQAFYEGLISIWEVSVNERKLIIATNSNVMPRVPGAMSAANIKALTADRLPLIGKMLFDKVGNEKTNTLSVLMTGHQDYWHIIGFIKSKHDYLSQRCVIKPTPESHPQVSEKVNALYKLIIAREMKTLAAHASKLNVSNLQFSNTTKPIQPNPVATENKVAPVQQSILVKSGGIPADQMPPSNIEIKIMTSSVLDSTITIPIPVKEDHLWLMLSTVDDFSHIYVPSWKNFLSHDRIKKSVLLASCHNKTVRLGKVSAGMDIYATPDSWYRIYFGPFKKETDLNLILYQNIDGKMLLREDFERSQNIKREKRTVAYWIYIKNSQLIYNMNQMKNTANKSLLEPVVSTDEESDEECMIVDEPQVESTNSIVTVPDEPISKIARFPTAPQQLKIPIKDFQKIAESSKSLFKTFQLGATNPKAGIRAKQIIARRNTIMPQTVTSTTINSPTPSRQSLPLAPDSTSLLQSNPILVNQLQTPTQLSNSAMFKKLPKDLMIIPENEQKTVATSEPKASSSTSLKSQQPNATSTVTAKDKINPSTIQKLDKKSIVRTITQRRMSLPVQPQYGYIISNSLSVGKVPAERTLKGYTLKFPHNSERISLSSMEEVSQYLSGLLKKALRNYYDEWGPFNWKFVQFGAEEKKYQFMNMNALFYSLHREKLPTPAPQPPTPVPQPPTPVPQPIPRQQSAATPRNILPASATTPRYILPPATSRIILPTHANKASKPSTNEQEMKKKIPIRNTSQPSVPVISKIKKPQFSPSDVILIDD